MFTKPLNYIITKKSLIDAYEAINKNSSGIDSVTFEVFEKDFNKNMQKLHTDILEGVFSPEPLKKIAIDKPDSKEKRPIGLSAIKDKLVQKVLYENLNLYYDKLFSTVNFAKLKSPLQSQHKPAFA